MGIEGLKDFLDKKVGDIQQRLKEEWQIKTNEEKAILLSHFDEAIFSNFRAQTEIIAKLDPLCFEFASWQIEDFFNQQKGEYKTTLVGAFLLGLGMGALWGHLVAAGDRRFVKGQA